MKNTKELSIVQNCRLRTIALCLTVGRVWRSWTYCFVLAECTKVPSVKTKSLQGSKWIFGFHKPFYSI